MTDVPRGPGADLEAIERWVHWHFYKKPDRAVQESIKLMCALVRRLQQENEELRADIMFMARNRAALARVVPEKETP